MIDAGFSHILPAGNHKPRVAERTANMRRLTALLLALAGAPTFAQEVRGPYVGFGIDQIDYSASLYRVEMDDSAMSRKLVAGFRFRETLAFEAHYAESDDFVANESGYVLPWTSPIGPIGFDTTATIVGAFDPVSAPIPNCRAWLYSCAEVASSASRGFEGNPL